MGKIGTLTSFTSGTTAKASEVNGNFDEIKTKTNTYGMWVDSACTVSVGHTFSAAQTFGAGISLTGTLTMATAASTLVPGATSFTIRNNADSADNLKVLDSGATTIRNALTVSAGGATITGNSTITGTLGGLTGLTMASGTLSAVDLTVSGTFTPNGLTSNGNLTFSGASRRIIPGTSSLTIRNVGNTVDAISVQSTVVAIGGSATISEVQIGTGSNTTIGNTGMSTNATAGFLVLPGTNGAGAPTGAVNQYSCCVDDANSRLYIRIGSTWKYASLT